MDQKSNLRIVSICEDLIVPIDMFVTKNCPYDAIVGNNFLSQFDKIQRLYNNFNQG